LKASPVDLFEVIDVHETLDYEKDTAYRYHHHSSRNILPPEGPYQHHAGEADGKEIEIILFKVDESFFEHIDHRERQYDGRFSRNDEKHQGNKARIILDSGESQGQEHEESTKEIAERYRVLRTRHLSGIVTVGYLDEQK
jgi:hypothetical protein